METEPLTPFEAAVLARLAEDSGDAALRRQLAGARAAQREPTGAGCYTTLVLAADAPATQAGYAARGPLSGPGFESPALEHGGGALLWFLDGRAHELELFAHGDRFPADHAELADFRFVAVARRPAARGRVRRAAAADLEAVRSIRLASLADAPDAFGSDLKREEAFTADDWRARIERDAIFLYEEDGVARGVVAGSPHRERTGTAYLIAMWVHPERRGAGVGRALVGAVIDWARSSGYAALVLDVAEHNARARRLYERSGFRATGERREVPERGLVEVELRLALDDRARPGRPTA